MSVIPEKTVAAAWNEIAGMAESQGQAEIERITRNQPELLAFVMADSQDLRADAQELAVFIFVIVLRMFEKHFGSKLRTVEIEDIERLRDGTEASLLALSEADEASMEQAALSQATGQPFVMKYIAEAIFEPDPDDDVHLTEDEIGGMFMTLKTVVDALQEASGSKATPSS